MNITSKISNIRDGWIIVAESDSNTLANPKSNERVSKLSFKSDLQSTISNKYEVVDKLTPSDTHSESINNAIVSS